eukprot:UN3347
MPTCCKHMDESCRPANCCVACAKMQGSDPQLSLSLCCGSRHAGDVLRLVSELLDVVVPIRIKLVRAPQSVHLCQLLLAAVEDQLPHLVAPRPVGLGPLREVPLEHRFPRTLALPLNVRSHERCARPFHQPLAALPMIAADASGLVQAVMLPRVARGFRALHVASGASSVTHWPACGRGMVFQCRVHRQGGHIASHGPLGHLQRDTHGHLGRVVRLLQLLSDRNPVHAAPHRVRDHVLEALHCRFNLLCQCVRAVRAPHLILGGVKRVHDGGLGLFE